MSGTNRKSGFTSLLLSALALAVVCIATQPQSAFAYNPHPTIAPEVANPLDHVASPVANVGSTDYAATCAIIEFKFSDNYGNTMGVTNSPHGRLLSTPAPADDANYLTSKVFTAHPTTASEVATNTDKGTTDLALIVTMKSAATSSTHSGTKEMTAGAFARCSSTGLVSVTCGDASAKKTCT